MKRKLVSVLLSVSLVAAMVMGCSNGDGDKKSSSTKTESTSNKKGGHKFGYTCMDGTNPFFVTLEDEIRKKVEANGDKLVSVDPANDVSLQVQQVEDLISQGIDAMFLNPAEAEGILPAMDALKGANIPIVNFDTEVADMSYATSYVGSDNYNAGKVCGEDLVKKCPKGGDIIVLDSPTMNSIVDRTKGFTDAIKGKGFNIVAQQDAKGNLETSMGIMLQFAKKASVPVCVHLDHGESIESCIKAIQLGFSSVMIDASGSDYEENIRITAEVVRLAHAVDVTVEAELGHIFSSDKGLGDTEEIETADSFSNLDDVYTSPDMAKDFVEKTGVDVLAIAFGTSHGIYTQKPVLDLNRITEIKNKIDIPFVMHGGSGLSKEEFQTAVKNGIRKINYYTYMTLAGGKAVKAALDKKSVEENIFYHDIPLIAMKAMKENVKVAIETFALKN